MSAPVMAQVIIGDVSGVEARHVGDPVGDPALDGL